MLGNREQISFLFQEGNRDCLNYSLGNTESQQITRLCPDNFKLYVLIYFQSCL